MKASEYADLLRSYLSLRLSVAQLVERFNAAFLAESANTLDENLFWILEEIFESLESYSPLWEVSDENEYRITEPTLRNEMKTALTKLETYQSPG
jgi:hypothetical protein